MHPTGTGRRSVGERDPLSLSLACTALFPLEPSKRCGSSDPLGIGEDLLRDPLLAAETSAQHNDESERQADGRQEVRVRIWGLQVQFRRRRLHHAHVGVCTYALCTHKALAPTAAHIYINFLNFSLS